MYHVITIIAVEERKKLICQVRKLLDISYSYLGGIPHTDDQLVETDGPWRLVIKDDQVIAGAIYRHQNGFKLRLAFQIDKDALVAVLEDLRLDGFWVEASCKLQRFLVKHNHHQQPVEMALKTSSDISAVVDTHHFIKFGKPSSIFGFPS